MQQIKQIKATIGDPRRSRQKSSPTQQLLTAAADGKRKGGLKDDDVACLVKHQHERERLYTITTIKESLSNDQLLGDIFHVWPIVLLELVATYAVPFQLQHDWLVIINVSRDVVITSPPKFGVIEQPFGVVGRGIWLLDASSSSSDDDDRWHHVPMPPIQGKALCGGIINGHIVIVEGNKHSHQYHFYQFSQYYDNATTLQALRLFMLMTIDTYARHRQRSASPRYWTLKMDDVINRIYQKIDYESSGYCFGVRNHKQLIDLYHQRDLLFPPLQWNISTIRQPQSRSIISSNMNGCGNGIGVTPPRCREAIKCSTVWNNRIHLIDMYGRHWAFEMKANGTPRGNSDNSDNGNDNGWKDYPRPLPGYGVAPVLIAARNRLYCLTGYNSDTAIGTTRDRLLISWQVMDSENLTWQYLSSPSTYCTSPQAGVYIPNDHSILVCFPIIAFCVSPTNESIIHVS
jgi:hypothetical protein